MSGKSITLTLGGSRYNIRPCMEIVFEIEGEIDGIPALYDRLKGNRWKVTELVILMQILLQAVGRTEDLKALYAHMLEEGLPKFHTAAVSFLGMTLSDSPK